MDPPTAPPNLVRPLVTTSSDWLPFNVPPKPIVAPSVLVTSVSAPSVTASPKLCAPVVRTEPPFRAVVPAASVVSEVSAVVPPTAPPKLVAPVPLTVRA